MRKTVQIGKKIKKEFPNLVISDQKVGSIERFLQFLSKWNKKINLTAIRSYDDMVVKHVLDAITCLTIEPSADNQPFLRGQVLDLGSGAGIPGIILAICEPAIHLTSVDKSAKKTLFQEQVVRSLNLNNITVLKERLEDLAQRSNQHMTYDVIISRAFDQIKGILTFSRQFIKPAGKVILWKGSNWKNELRDVEDHVLSFYTLVCSHAYQFEESGHGGILLVFQKKE